MPGEIDIILLGMQSKFHNVFSTFITLEASYSHQKALENVPATDSLGYHLDECWLMAVMIVAFLKIRNASLNLVKRFTITCVSGNFYLYEQDALSLI